MEIPVVEIAIAIAGIGSSWGVVHWRLSSHEAQRKEDRDTLDKRMDRERLELLKEQTDQWAIITKFRDWTHLHEKESSDYRLVIEKQFGEVHIKLADNTGRFEQIMAAILQLNKQHEEIRKELSDLIKNQNHE